MRPSISCDELERPNMDCVPRVVVIKYASEDRSDKMDMEFDPLDTEPVERMHKINPSTTKRKEDRWSPSLCEKSHIMLPPQRKPSESYQLMLKKSRMAPAKPLRLPSPRKTPRRKLSEKVKTGDLRKPFLLLK
ncbi:hypothetical protein FisN_29Lu029 [Fistulifera solaris]|uniref:Uncharacterized protein n=1 Tax=Fistulifera solaris TaxID=1519565 RepID=A0A1Z5JM12_FISSO|nr:hypothetical protein FisN_29Lu029 [Fistulifera solaris]|eukprot:GAX14821.1 hypothetical protein FisN_29Lu029 [Fistulifera solaris]